MMNTIDSLIHNPAVVRLVQIALHEDIGTGDVTTEAIFPSDLQSRAGFLMKQSGVVCGLHIAKLVFHLLSAEGDEVIWLPEVSEGDFVEAGTVLAYIEGSAATLLTGERTALNFMQRMSGVASAARLYVEAVKGTGAVILDTRKTIPGWRGLDKYAVRIGGAENHRCGLYDMIMIKDNHIAAAGSITEAVKKCKDELAGRDIPIEVETASLEDVQEALDCGGIQRIMFDNFTPHLMEKAVKMVNKTVETEASGGINLKTIRKYAETGVDFISVGAITHSAPAMDISMDFEFVDSDNSA